MTWEVLDLFCGLGGFSSAFAESPEWSVTTVDIKATFDADLTADVFDLRPSDFEPDFDVVLASPPCYQLSTSGNHDKWDFENQRPTAPESCNAVALFHHAVGLIHGLAPEYYYIENPRRSRIRWTYGPPDEWVSYCQYGMDYQKQTGLWGEFAPMTFKRCSGSGNCHRSNTEDDGAEAVASMNDGDKAERALVPYELSESIRDACEAGLTNSVPEQATLFE
jgi:hypothetical protein